MSFLKLLSVGILLCSLVIGQTNAQTQTPLQQAANGPLANDASSSHSSTSLCEKKDGQQSVAEHSDICRNWSLLLGEWTNLDYGGTIEFKLLPDKTVSAYIVKVSERMLKQGYAKDMQIARGWELGGTDAGTWKVFARNGEVLSAKLPSRDAGSIFGTAKWVEGGIIHIHRDRAGIVNLPAQLEGRISDYKDWVRVEGKNANAQSRPTSSEFCPVISNPVCGTKNGDTKVFNNICDAEKTEFRPVHMAQCRTSIDPAVTPPAFNFQCTHASKPACAIDLDGLKRTFSNVCNAEAENHSILYEGACKPNPIIGSDANSMICSAEFKPVCAEKNNQNRTFRNACEAVREKFKVLSQAPCR